MQRSLLSAWFAANCTVTQCGGCTPHFLWLRQRKRAVHGPKEKRFWVSNFAPKGQSWTDGRWWLDVPPSPEISCWVRYTGYGDRHACPHLGAGVLGWGGHRKAFSNKPRVFRFATHYLVLCRGTTSKTHCRNCPGSAERSGERGKERWSFQSLPDPATPIRVAKS